MPRILIVDDKAQVREMLRKVFVKEGYDAVTTPLASQAVDIVFSEPFDVILLDIRLSPQTSGIDVLKRVKASRSDLPVVVYSTAMTPELEKQARDAGASDVSGNIADLEDLVMKVSRVASVGTSHPVKQKAVAERTLLVVDDDRGIRTVLSAFFGRKGYRVLEAASGEEAIKLTGLHEISAVLLDIIMPVMDGLETLQRLREMRKDLPVIMVTAVGDETAIKKAVQLGASGYALKPFDFLYLELLLSSAILGKGKA